MKNANIKGLAHIGIFVKNIDTSIDFYKRLGFSFDSETDIGIRLAFLSAGSCLLELVEQKDSSALPSGTIDHIAVEVDNIESAIADANASGINIDASKIEALPILGGIKNVFFEGPDGERLEFFEYSKK